MNWPAKDKRNAVSLFFVACALIILLTLRMAPQRLLSFPMQRPGIWALVMVLYPLLSALPQELVFRSFFFKRYEPLFPKPSTMVLASALTFGLMHLVFHNWIAPVLSFLGGLIFAHHYDRHRSLKWVTIEHGFYGCMVFTIGIGYYFVIGSGLIHR